MNDMMGNVSVIDGTVIRLGVLVVLGSASTLFGQKPEDVLADLAKRRAALGSLHHVTRTVTVEGDIEREATVIRWERAAEGARQIRLVTKTRSRNKDGAWGDEIETATINDGEFEWREMNAGESVMVFKSKADKADPLADVVEAVKSGQARIKGRESIAEHACIVLEATGRKESLFRAIYWISQEHGIVLQSELRRADRIRSEMKTASVTIGEKLPDNHFSYTPAEGVTVIDTGNLGRSDGD